MSEIVGMEMPSTPSYQTYSWDRPDTSAAYSASTGPSLANPSSLTANGKQPFFDAQTGIGKIGQGMNLAGSVLSLAQMIQSLSQARQGFRLNKQNMEEAMAQRKEAFDRNVDRQDRTTAAINNANSLAAEYARQRDANATV